MNDDKAHGMMSLYFVDANGGTHEIGGKVVDFTAAIETPSHAERASVPFEISRHTMSITLGECDITPEMMNAFSPVQAETLADMARQMERLDGVVMAKSLGASNAILMLLKDGVTYVIGFWQLVYWLREHGATVTFQEAG